MKKSLIFSALVSVSLFFVTGCSKKTAKSASNEVIVYTYDSFIGEWGPGPEISRLFEEKTGVKVVFEDCGDGVQILSKALLEKDAPYADVLLGLDNNLTEKAFKEGVFMEYKPKNADKLIDKELSAELNPNGKWIMTPFDYSHFAMIFDTMSDLPAPASLEDLTKDIYKKKIILLDGKTSTVGLGFDNWVKAVYGNDAAAYMKRLEPSILTVSPSWSIGYGMFTKGEAPLVISYTTSPAYHVEYGEGDRFQAIIFEQGHVRQIEGAGVVKGARNLDNAKAFIDFLISDEAQSCIPLTQWMFPVNKNTKLPESYAVAAPVPSKTLK